MITVFGQTVAISTFISWIFSTFTLVTGQILDYTNKYAPNEAVLVGAILSGIGLLGFIWTTFVHQSTVVSNAAAAQGKVRAQ